MTLLACALAITLQATPAPVETIARGTMSQIDTASQVVARTPAEFDALWRKHAAPNPPPGKIDFASRMVVAVFLGSRPSAGYTVEIVGTRQVAGILTVEWREQTPQPGEMTAQMLTSPMHIALVPKFAGEVRFQKVAP